MIFAAISLAAGLLAYFGLRRSRKQEDKIGMQARPEGEIEMNRQWPSEDPSSAENMILGSLLEVLETALDDVRMVSGGRPLFLVEAELTARLRRDLPRVRFSAEDIWTWSGQISS